MKGTTVATMVATASTAVAFSSSAVLNHHPFSHQGCSSSSSSVTNVGVRSSRMSSIDGEKFTPRFDGLRFIETLVTAHR